MNSPFFFGVGGVVSADIAAPDHEREQSFYANVLTTGSAPLWREDLHNRNGTPIIGLGKRTPEYESLPLQWMPHFQVADVGTSVERAIELGGRELMHGKDSNGNSQWAGLADASGAAFGVIPIVDEATAKSYESDQIAYISWLSLASPDAQAACEFYEKVIGWKTVPSGDSGSHEIRRGDGVVAGEIRPASSRDDIPSVWILHVPVNDLSESLRRVVQNGGKVLEASRDHRKAVLQDPIGVHFGLQSSE
ncbi:MAG: VOC family protein [Phycisphaerales bacterium]